MEPLLNTKPDTLAALYRGQDRFLRIWTCQQKIQRHAVYNTPLFTVYSIHFLKEFTIVCCSTRVTVYLTQGPL